MEINSSDPFSCVSRKEKAFYKAAEAMSTLSDHKSRHGAVVVEHGCIISSGHNSSTRCSRIQADLDSQYFRVEGCHGPLHAETMALLPLIRKRYEFSNTTLYIFRRDRLGNLAQSRPCPRCMELIKRCGIKKIKYTTADGFTTEKLVY